MIIKNISFQQSHRAYDETVDATSPAIAAIKESITNSMQRPKSTWEPEGSVVNENTRYEPVIIRKAMAIRHKFSLVPLFIWPGQLIGGSLADPEKDILISGSLPEYATEEEITAAKAEGLNINSIVGHIVPSYERLLFHGTSGIRVEAHQALDESRGNAAFYQAVLIVMEGLELLARRYSDAYKKLSQAAACAQDSKRLLRISKALRRSPERPPRTFMEAVQTVWLTHMAFQMTGNNLAMGRLDQYLYPYLDQDLFLGRLNQDQAQKITDCLYLKYNERSIANHVMEEMIDIVKAQERNEQVWQKRSPFDHATQKYNVRDSIDATNHWLQNVIIGGVEPITGDDASNLLSLMILSSLRRLKMTNPCITVRLHSQTPDLLMQSVAGTLLEGGGQPALFNDDVIVPSLTSHGFSLEDARNYTNDGCWEVIVPGATDFYFDRFNILKCLEWLLNHGRSRIDGRQEAPDPGSAEQYQRFDDLMAGFYQMLDYELSGIMHKIDSAYGKRAKIAPTPLLSALLEGPMEKGQDMTAGGARYQTYGLIAEGFSHLIDSLAAIKKVVYEDQSFSMQELLAALDANFSGYEQIQNAVRQAPKYGNHDAFADQIGQDIIDAFARKTKALNQALPRIKYLPGAGTFSWYLAIGEGIGPTPDGRLRASGVSSNFSPSEGASAHGAAAAVLSHASMDLSRLPTGAPLDLRIEKRNFEGDGGSGRLIGLLRSFVALKSNMLTLTIEDTALLREAQQHPEKHPDLRVRMGGWSAYFTMLSKEQQDYHIGKASE